MIIDFHPKKIQKLVRELIKFIEEEPIRSSIPAEIKSEQVGRVFLGWLFLRNKILGENPEPSVLTAIRTQYWELNSQENLEGLNKAVVYLESALEERADFETKLYDRISEATTIDLQESSSNEKKTRAGQLLSNPTLAAIVQFITLLQYLRYIPNKVGQNSEKKARGSFYTPPGIIVYMLEGVENQFLKSTSDTDPFKILDYASGMGLFLIYAAALISMIKSQNPAMKEKKVQYYGFDTDEYAVRCGRLCCTFLSLTHGFEAEMQNIHFWETNTLDILPNTIWDNSVLIPTSRFQEEYFDIIVSNPPYKSWGLGRVGTLSDTLKEQYKIRFAKTAEYKISYYAIFLERAVQLLKPGGFSAFILPDSFLMGKYFRKLRRFLLEKTQLKEICVFAKNFWKNADSGFPVILQFTSQPTDKNQPAMFNSVKTRFEDGKVHIEQSYRMEAASFLRLARARFRLFFSKETAQFVERFESDAIPLKSFFEAHHGIRSRAGVGKKRIVSRHHNNQLWKPGLITGNSVLPFYINYQGHFILTNAELLYSGGFDPELIEQTKIILRRTGDRLIAAVDTKDFYHTNTLIYLIPKSDEICPLSLYALCAILNSATFNKYYQIISLKAGRTLPQVEIDMLHEFPLKMQSGILRELDDAGRLIHRLRKRQHRQSFDPEMQKSIDLLFSLIEEAVRQIYLG